ncbi:hypothetical protein G6F68_014533 [Rhizopus microsporus]|nr:hypothetical protein G6F68_014533 [Rhizopus microsporus]
MTVNESVNEEEFMLKDESKDNAEEFRQSDSKQTAEIKEGQTTEEEANAQKDVLEQVTSSEGIPFIEDGEDEEDEDGGEWITPENVDEYKASEIGVTPEELRQTETVTVGCMTADFAMQNVLLQMNLNLVSSGGYRVKKIRNSVMRCHACFT